MDTGVFSDGWIRNRIDRLNSVNVAITPNAIASIWAWIELAHWRRRIIMRV